MQKIICLMGPTASGKTALAMQLADNFPCDIISVDSAMVYRGMDIGTAKPTAAELEQYPHALVDIRDPNEPYSAADFRQDALACIQQSFNDNRTPLLVGGTMLYFKALQEGLSDLPEADADVRAALLARAEKEGWQALHDTLQSIDPVSAARIHPNDPQRLQRALEVYELTGKTLTELQSLKTKESLPYHYINTALMPDDRDELRQRIATRFHQMIDLGLIDEVKALRDRGDLQSGLPSMRAVGYRQVWDYLDGQLSKAAMIERAVIATAQLAKRQMTWLRGWPNVHVLSGDDLVEQVKALL